MRGHRTTVTVTENRAPTDESVRMLRELEKEARASVVNSIKIDNNELRGVVVHLAIDPAQQTRRLYIRFRFNGKRLHIITGLATG